MKKLLFCLPVVAISFMATGQGKSGNRFAVPFNPEGKKVTIYSTAKGTDQRISMTGTSVFVPVKEVVEDQYVFFINPGRSFQPILGIGGAITDASAEVFSKLSPEKQKQLLQSYFDSNKGIGYNLCRTTIHSCDFSPESYTYVKEGDKELKSFDISHDKAFRIPMLKQAKEAAGGKLLLYASPWSPPAFMKDNNSMLRGGKLLAEYAPSWANYYTKFIKAYEAEGLPIWGLTVQNEAMAIQRWESCVYTPEEERDFVKNHLGPAMEREGLADKKIIVYDHNRDFLNHNANIIFSDSLASKYTWGIGFHWYEHWTGTELMFENVGKFSEAYPDKGLIFTEGCVEGFRERKLQYWGNGERYGRALINDFNNGAMAWTDWNILLDENGGPNHVSNFCFAPVHANLKTGELIYTPSYYYLGHFSKFIRPNARRISTASSRSQLLGTSFTNEDGSQITVVMNTESKKVDYSIQIGSYKAELTILPHSIQTLVY